MKLLTRTAIALVAALGAAPVAAQYMTPAPAAPPPMPRVPDQQQSDQASTPVATGAIRPSAKALKPLLALQKAVEANDAANIPTLVAAAQAAASTKEDHYLLARLQLKAAVAANDKAGMASAVDAIASSGVQSPTEVGQLYMGLGSTYYNEKQYDLAAAAFQKGSAIDPNNTDILLNLGEARFAQGQPAQAVAAFQRVIQIKTAAGQKPDEKLFKRALSIAYDAKLPSAIDISRAWVAAYPNAESWHNTIAVYRNTSHQDLEGTLDLLRLMQAAGALTSPADYAMFVESAAEQNNFTEAQAVVDEGIAAKVINPSSAEFRDIVAGVKAKQKASAAELAAAAKTATSGVALMQIGERFYGMGNYAQAADLFRQAKGKGGVDSDLANLHLGMALARSGDKAGATAAFNAVTGARADIAKLWVAYLQQKA
jgi:tetratricopeptide (TPR) repeat protein